MPREMHLVGVFLKQSLPPKLERGKREKGLEKGEESL